MFFVIKDLEDYIEGLRKLIVESSVTLHEMNDHGQIHSEDNPCEIRSFTRGQQIGLIISRDRAQKILDKIKSKL